VSTERLADACASLEADVLCLQEIDRGQTRSGGVDQTAAVARRVGAADWRFEPALVGEPGGRWRPATGGDLTQAAYGVGLVSRRPVRAWHVVRLKAARVRAPVAVPGGRGRFILLPDEPRVALAAEVDLDADADGRGGPLLVATTHLSFVPGYNLWQLRRLTRALERLGRPCLLLGDLNVPGPIPGWAAGWRPLVVKAPTYPAGNPRLQVDHVLAWGPVPPVAAVETRRLPLSDHLALVVDMRPA
jgi:endonuclease/exonuclease/phosphatase family metal-dependent hydrolase